MPDATTEAIDRFFDLVDNGVDQVGRVLGCDKQPTEKPRARRARGSEVVVREVLTKPSPAKPLIREARTLPMTSLARRPRFYIVEAVVSGSTQFVVTDGGSARTACVTRQFAEQILQALERAQ